ncbi:MAG TPA: ferritin-like domain-containing protein [Candidatus Binatia bacterium]
MKFLLAEYESEIRMSQQLEADAHKMAYPQFRERLSQIAADERRHARWLGEQIEALGGQVPEVSWVAKSGRNPWACLLDDAAGEKRCLADIEELLSTAGGADPELARGLRRMVEEEKRHREEITDMLMRSDPFASSLE